MAKVKKHATKKEKVARKAVAKKTAAKKATAEAAPKRVTKARATKAAPAAKKDSLQIFDLQGKAVETLNLDPIFTDGAPNTDVIYQAILMYQAGEREGTASTKNRGDVRGGGKKPWKQKGTGQARHGSRRSPIWRGGGATFGPSPRDYSYSIPQTMRRKAVVEVIKDKVSNGKLLCVNQINIDAPKTKKVAGILETFKLEKPLFLVDKKSENLMLASRNIQAVSVKTADEVNALDLAKHQECLMTKAAYAGLVKRLKS